MVTQQFSTICSLGCGPGDPGSSPMSGMGPASPSAYVSASLSLSLSLSVTITNKKKIKKKKNK